MTLEPLIFSTLGIRSECLTNCAIQISKLFSVTCSVLFIRFNPTDQQIQEISQGLVIFYDHKLNLF